MDDHPIHDQQMPKGWHTIKSVLLTEMRTAANFHLCMCAADALFHARLVGQSIARQYGTRTEGGTVMGCSAGAQPPVEIQHEEAPDGT